MAIGGTDRRIGRQFDTCSGIERTGSHDNLTIVPRHIPGFQPDIGIDRRNFLYGLDKVGKLLLRIKTHCTRQIRRKAVNGRIVLVAQF